MYTARQKQDVQLFFFATWQHCTSISKIISVKHILQNCMYSQEIYHLAPTALLYTTLWNLKIKDLLRGNTCYQFQLNLACDARIHQTRYTSVYRVHIWILLRTRAGKECSSENTRRSATSAAKWTAETAFDSLNDWPNVAGYHWWSCRSSVYKRLRACVSTIAEAVILRKLRVI